MLNASPGPFKLLLRATCPENVKTREDSLIFTHSQNIPHFQAIAGPFKLYCRPRVQKMCGQGRMNLHKRFPHPPPYLPLFEEEDKSQMTMFSAQTIQSRPLMIIKQRPSFCINTHSALNIAQHHSDNKKNN